MRNLSLNLTLVFCSLLIGFTFIELLGRFYIEPEIFLKRTLFFSERPWKFLPPDVITYPPNATMRTVAVYSDSVEYDIIFSTNNLGFIDSKNYTKTDKSFERRIAIIGNSFTAGYHSGAPWVPGLRTSIGFSPDRHRIFNLGVDGTGLPHFRSNLLRYWEILDPNELLIVIITDDISRPLWRPFYKDENVYMCPIEMDESRCPSFLAFISIAPKHFSREDLVKLSYSKWNYPILSRRWLQQNSYILSWLFRKAHRVLLEGKLRRQGLEELGKLRDELEDVKIRVLHLPEKHELRTGLRREIEQEIESFQIEYYNGAKLCRLTEDDYLGRDNHYNAIGYRKLTDCVARIIGL